MLEKDRGRNPADEGREDVFGALGLLRTLSPVISLAIALGMVAWAHFNTGLVLYWDGSAMSHEWSTMVAAGIALCWHVVVLAAGRPSLFGEPVVFATGSLLPLIAFALSSSWFFQPSAWTAGLAVATAVAVLAGGATRSVVCQGRSAPEAARAVVKWLSYGVAVGFIAMRAATIVFSPAELAIEGHVERGLDSQQAFERLVAAPPSTASQQEIADALAGLASAEAARLGVERKPRVAIEFDPYAPYAARTEGDAISVNARYLSADPSENAFNVVHEVFHQYQQEVVDGAIDPATTDDAVARQLAKQHAADWARELEDYSSIYGGRPEYEGQLLEKDADAYANITVNVLAGRISYSS